MAQRKAVQPNPEHPLHVLLENKPKEGQERLWKVFEEAGYSFSLAARLLGVNRLSLTRWLRKFKLRDEFTKRKVEFARAQLEER